MGVLAEMMDQHPEAAFTVAEAFSGFFIAEVFDKIGSQGLILAMGGGCGFEKDPGEIGYLFL
jgi:hypothetical protein